MTQSERTCALFLFLQKNLLLVIKIIGNCFHFKKKSYYALMIMVVACRDNLLRDACNDLCIYLDECDCEKYRVKLLLQPQKYTNHSIEREVYRNVF